MISFLITGSSDALASVVPVMTTTITDHGKDYYQAHCHDAITANVVIPIFIGTSPADIPVFASLMNDVAANALNEWRSVAILLNITLDKINAISTMHHNDPIRCYTVVFQEWINARTRPYTWSTIVDALESKLVSRQDLANNIKLKYMQG